MYHRVEDHLVQVNKQVDDITSQLVSFEEEEYRKDIEGAITEFLRVLEEVVTTLRYALLFMLMKASGSGHWVGVDTRVELVLCQV